MGQPIALTKITIEQNKPPHRQAFVDGFEEPFDFGTHGGVKEFYGHDPDVEYPSTLDHIVAAAGG
ncbi:hypothetical protein [Alteribacillus iranensis]|uniref:Uncharacterized protein n=1 Tax=Alteribacillus iranensis TaxID=930128 RepID=A0A1I2D2R9_9BACI|nr:hypothetical protein [Alteribacillus iranensis]SFE74775.1 hypothetical protein SAMN05192532_103365 [Alteribacillus iranensis]